MIVAVIRHSIMTDRHKKKEFAIFKAFAEICGLPIKLDSVDKKNPPEPDILCEVSGNGLLAFELVEIIDRDFANTLVKQIATQNELKKYLSILPNAVRVKFNKLYSNALISILFKNSCTLRKRKKCFL